VLCKSTRTHFHHFTPSRPPSPEKPPKLWRTRGKHHARRTSSHHRNEPFESNFSFNLLPEDIFGTEEVPEHILSDSSSEEEDATHEQKVNHQLCHRIWHLEHDLQDITACCCAERECHMSLEALVGGKIFILI
jgi:hypothetical protein